MSAAYFYIKSIRFTSSILHIYILSSLVFFASTWERTCFDQNFLLGGVYMVAFTPGGGGSFERKIIMWFSGGWCIPQLQKFTILAPSLGVALLTVNTCALLEDFSWLYFFLMWIIMGLKILYE